MDLMRTAKDGDNGTGEMLKDVRSIFTRARSEDGRLMPREDSEAQPKIVSDRRDSQLVAEVKAKGIAAGGCSGRGR
ncbi:hypothetical protein BJ912DRAFT_1060022 [Pholiota molesta]|nr:hypothetical protein BJ912DRAFT_1060022 [Pholiota molesta]